MNIKLKQIFKYASDELNIEFKKSKPMKHNGNKGAYREDQLYDFLRKMLPKKYGLGNGEIISPFQEVSRQTEIIIFNQLEFTPLLASRTVQVFPIESVYGIVEVKSKLSRNKLLEGLENIKSIKSIAPQDKIYYMMPGSVSVAIRERPIGIIFAYSLANNSLRSLEKNLIEWEAKNNRDNWPNLIVVLNEGIIYHCGNIDHTRCLSNKDISQYGTGTIAIQFKEDSLFQFYSILLDLCNGIRLGNLDLQRYFEPYEKMGELIVRGHDKCLGTGSNFGKGYRLTKEFMEKVYNYCKNQPQITQNELILKISGGIPCEGIEGTHFSNQKLYLYNPENLQGIINGSLPAYKDKVGNVIIRDKTLVPSFNFDINNENYCIPQCYITDNDYEEIK